jgi:hypothetical protein
MRNLAIVVLMVHMNCRLAHQAHVQLIRNMQLQREADLEHALTTAPRLGQEEVAESSSSVGVAMEDRVEVTDAEMTKSFARITQLSGYFPSMSTSGVNSSNRQSTPQPALPLPSAAATAAAVAGTTVWGLAAPSRRQSPGLVLGGGGSLNPSTPRRTKTQQHLPDTPKTPDDDDEIHMLAASPPANRNRSSGGSGSGSKGKKKGKGTSLFSTSGYGQTLDNAVLIMKVYL